MKVLLIDDHQLVSESLAAILKTSLGVSIDIKNNVKEALDHLQSGHIYNYIILDLNMPELDGFQFMDTLNDLDIFFPIIIVSGSENPEDLKKLSSYDISGFVAKTSGFAKLKASLERIFSGEVVIPDEYQYYFNETNLEKEVCSGISLSNRRKEVLRLFEQGLSYEEVATKLFISKNTVKHHLNGISKILEVSGSAKCVNKAKELGLI